MPTFKLDGQTVPFEPGDTIIRAAERAGIDIPHYCWHPGLSVAANCRMCLVELPPPAGRRAMMLDVLHYDPEKGEYVKSQKPKLVPACQQVVAEGMEVLSESSGHARQARAAVQELLLLNHPVDCPICDQAGECYLQDYWYSVSRHKKRMHDEVVHKPKAVSFGPTIVYDAERCIVCTRCVRLCKELAKDPVLGVRERGNLNEIAVAPGRQLDHNYTLMTEYVCPVGALTSKDFRFKARVWFLQSARGICSGCSRGCNSFIDFDPRNNTVYRYRPRYNASVNQYWMCDRGMLDYRRPSEGRVLEPRVAGEVVALDVALNKAAAILQAVAPERLAVVLSAQFSQEDNLLVRELGCGVLGSSAVFYSGRPDGESDGILMTADRNPNRRGVLSLPGSVPVRSFAEFAEAIESGRVTHVLVLGSDALLADKGDALDRAGVSIVALATHEGPFVRRAAVVLPASSFLEYEGTYVNLDGIAQRSERAIEPLGRSLPAWKLVAELCRALGRALPYKKLSDVRAAIQGDPAPARASEAIEGVASP